MLEWLERLAGSYGIAGDAGSLLALGVAIAGVLILAVATDWLVRHQLVRLAARIISRTHGRWDDRLLQEGVFKSLAHLAPAIVIYAFASAFGPAREWIERLAFVYMIAISAVVVNSALKVALAIYQESEGSRGRPIQGWIQLVSILVYILAAIGMFSVLLNREPWGLLTGLGALSAVLLLVFRDSILGFVASVQLSNNNMVRRGDWISMPSHGADGSVIEVSLYTVKVQNWDMTISTIPTQALITNSFKNWRGMEESEGRRIKRAVYIDISTIRLCSDEMLERFEHFDLIGDYVRSKRQELVDYNRERDVDGSQLVNGRRLTNVGTFRAYIEAYLRGHPKIHQGMTFLVRQLAPGTDGLPIEIYVFSSDQAWANYEGIQSDIFDHVLAVAPEFGLRIHQRPSGHELRGAAREMGQGPDPG